jgi:NADP-dependent 3-hydroxy acid dehydrogenase YdfG
MDLVLDTNIYRNLVRDQTDVQLHQLSETIKQQTEKQNIRIIFPINSAMELISHLNDDNESEKVECIKTSRQPLNNLFIHTYTC